MFSLRIWLTPIALTCAMCAPAHSQNFMAPKTATGLGVYDATGRYVGAVLDLNKIWIRLKDTDVLVNTDAVGAFAPDDLYFYYRTTTCSGDAFMDGSGVPMVAAFQPAANTAGVISKGTLFYATPPYSETLHFSSRRKVGDTACLTELPGYGLPGVAGKVGSVSIAGFTPPLTIK